MNAGNGSWDEELAAAPRIGYLTSRYPAISHSFIRREVAALRRAGLDLSTYSVRRTPAAELLLDRDRQEASRTDSILPLSPARLIGAHLWAACHGPRRYLAALGRALSRRASGGRALLWSLFYFTEAAVLARMLHRGRVEHLHCHFANAGSDVGLLAAELLGIPWSLTLHGTCDFEHPASETLGAKIRAARFVACVSHFGRAQAMRAVSSDLWDRLAIVRCGIELEEFPFRARPAPQDRPFRLLCVSRLAVEKGLPGLLRAVAGAVAADIPVELSVVGDGPDRSAVLRLAGDLGIADRCRFTGSLGGAGLRAEFEAADAFVLASLMEGLPVVLMEAMASGLPVVAPGLSGIPELVVHDQTGLLFQPGNWEDLARQIARLHRDPALGARLARAARGRAEDQHAIDVACRPLVELFRGRGSRRPQEVQA